MKGILAAAILIGLVIAEGTASAQSAPPAGPRFMLNGVVVVEGGGRAWLQEPVLTKNQVVAIRPGESIGPYRLTKVLDDRVEMTGPSGAFVVLLAGGSSPAVAAPQPKPPAREPIPSTNNDPNDPNRVVILPPGPPLAPLPPGTPRVDFGSLLRGVPPPR